MAASDQRGSNYFALGLIAGVALGASLALLFAPAPGEETRAALRDKGIELQARAGEVVTQARTRSREETGEKAVAAAEASRA